MPSPRNETWAALLSPPGKSALATVGLVGPMAWSILRNIFLSRNGKQLPDSPKSGSTYLGRLGKGKGDEIVLGVQSTYPCQARMHCHGGLQVVELVFDQLQKEGAHLCSWQEFTHLETPCKFEADARIALPQSKTMRTATILTSQGNGVLRTWFNQLVNEIRNNAIQTACGQITRALKWEIFGAHLVNPWKVVVAGASNAGKSSLVNALAGFQRSLVSAEEGTTRDVLWWETAMDGWPISLADMAGFRKNLSDLEFEGLQIGKEQALQSDLCLWLLDPTRPLVFPPDSFPKEKIQFVVNKIDLSNDCELWPENSWKVSALTGEGIENLINTISTRLIPMVPTADQAIPFESTFVTALYEALELLSQNRLSKTIERLTPWIME